MTDPWAAASAAQQGNAAPAGSSVMPEQAAQNGSGLGGGALFGGGGKRIPSLFNASHGKGTQRGGVIVDIKDVHSRTHSREGSQLRYWENTTRNQKGISPVTDAVSRVNGQANDPVMDVHIILDTEYRMSENECKVIGRDPATIAEDDGQRVYVVNDQRGFAEAINTFNKDGGNVTSPQGLIGLRLDSIRMAEPRDKGQAYPVKLSKPAA